MFPRFTVTNYQSICDELASNDAHLAAIIKQYGYPPLWSRPNTFETLVHLILEQQVSLASALSALNKLREKVGEVRPENVLLLSDEELKACYFSRQKTKYVRHLAEAMVSGQLDLETMTALPDTEIRAKLTALKGIGNWTTDVYLMFVLQHADIFPIGDLAAVNALKRVKQLPPETSKDEILAIINAWQPYRTVAAMLLWHWYLKAPNKPPLNLPR